METQSTQMDTLDYGNSGIGVFKGSLDSLFSNNFSLPLLSNELFKNTFGVKFVHIFWIYT